MKLSGGGDQDRGAAAVEFALVALMLITILFGIIEFGRLWMVQSSLSQIAREGVREMAIHDAEAARTLMDSRLADLNVTPAPVIASPAVGASCPPGSTATATITVTGISTLTGIDFWGAINLKGEAKMRCGG